MMVMNAKRSEVASFVVIHYLLKENKLVDMESTLGLQAINHGMEILYPHAEFCTLFSTAMLSA